MLNLQGIQESAKKFVADNATVILTAGGVVGTIGTGLLAWRGGFKAGLELRDTRIEKIKEYAAKTDPNKEIPLTADLVTKLYDEVGTLDNMEKARIIAPHAAPPIALGVGTIAAIIFSHRMSAQKAAALAAAYTVSERQFREYKDKVSEKLTGPKEQQIKDELAKDRSDETPGANQVIVVEGQVLCFDELTGRYFNSTMQQIREAVNKTNEQILHHDAVPASHFYSLLGLPETTWTREVGWNTDNLLDLEYSTIKSYDDRPALCINPKYLPHASYDRHTY